MKHDRDHQFKELVLQLKEHERREELSKKIQKEEVDELVRETLMYVKDSTKLIEGNTFIIHLIRNYGLMDSVCVFYQIL